MSQEVRTLKLEDLVLWTENPRDPIDETATDQDIVNCALEDKQSKWSLPKLAKEMGSHYDFSELPTVVFHGKKPVVYDGNRRIILGKIKHKLVSVDGFAAAGIPRFPTEIPCNVCSKEIALQNVLRKHADTTKRGNTRSMCGLIRATLLRVLRKLRGSEVGLPYQISTVWRL